VSSVFVYKCRPLRRLRSDITVCVVDECERLAFHCASDRTCGVQCDGKVDCSGGEDEAGCNGRCMSL
jgi:hypothetical protein